MPGMMDTILNLGMNDEGQKSLAEITSNPDLSRIKLSKIYPNVRIRGTEIPAYILKITGDNKINHNINQ